MDTHKRCSSCATEIALEARRCPHCRAFQAGATRVYRDPEHKLVAGVCAGIARELGMDPTLVRLVVAVLGVMSAGVVFWGYVVLWMITPASPLGVPPLATLLQRLRRFFGDSSQGQPRPQ